MPPAWLAPASVPASILVLLLPCTVGPGLCSTLNSSFSGPVPSHRGQHLAAPTLAWALLGTHRLHLLNLDTCFNLKGTLSLSSSQWVSSPGRRESWPEARQDSTLSASILGASAAPRATKLVSVGTALQVFTVRTGLNELSISRTRGQNLSPPHPSRITTTISQN